MRPETTYLDVTRRVHLGTIPTAQEGCFADFHVDKNHDEIDC
jgi:hypothetical protein